ncbi:OmpA family protein [Rubellimicrobium roseum]|uniref:OmpA family protein n=1 Tax=Rubellimicrobium roseum TaxID=687525 RepID=A0A5C4N464_9RHOB|nr:OmpA family protein [Rubellimicrobium roseum]TNC61951.1 OmpA family protein [Rubellimicrobium roseum]
MSFAGRLAAALAVMAAPVAALTLDLPPSATLALDEAEPLGSHALATSAWAQGTLASMVVEGEVTQRVWQVPSPDRTTLQLLAPLRDQIAAQGFRPLLDCAGEACGGFDFRAALEILPPPAMFVDLVDFRYLSAVAGKEAISLLVSRSGERGYIQLVRVAPARPEAQPATVPAAGPDTFTARIEGEGRVVLEGLAFRTGSADLAPGGEAMLAALAAYLGANAGRRVALVGHTDAQGPLAANVALSRQRAEAVAERLVSAHGVRQTQLLAEGMGWLAPTATNLTPEGRETNRRVEAVILPP